MEANGLPQAGSGFRLGRESHRQVCGQLNSGRAPTTADSLRLMRTSCHVKMASLTIGVLEARQ